MAKLIGYQVANHLGDNIQGDDECPVAFASYEVMTPECANAVIERIGNECAQRFLLQPIYEGDVEEHVMMDKLEIEAYWRD